MKESGGMMTPASPWIGSTMTPRRIAIDGFFQPVEIAILDKGAFQPEGFEGFADRRFVRDCQRTYRPPVEPVGESNKFLLPGPDPGQFQRTVGRLCPGVGEEGLVHPGNLHEFLCKFSLVGDIIQVGAVDEFMRLVADRFYHRRVAVPGAADGDPGNAVDILLSFRIPDQ